MIHDSVAHRSQRPVADELHVPSLGQSFEKVIIGECRRVTAVISVLLAVGGHFGFCVQKARKSIDPISKRAKIQLPSFFRRVMFCC